MWRYLPGLLFDVLDTDDSGDISPEEVIMGLAKLPVRADEESEQIAIVKDS